MFWKNFIQLCENNNKKPTAVIVELELSRGSVTHWKNGKIPSSYNLKKIADYSTIPVVVLGGIKKNTLPLHRNW